MAAALELSDGCPQGECSVDQVDISHCNRQDVMVCFDSIAGNGVIVCDSCPVLGSRARFMLFRGW